MTRPRHLVRQNVVVTAQFFNPSLFRESWLVNNGFLEEGELLPGFVFSDQVANAPTERFRLLVMPQQLQFETRPGTPSQDVVTELLASMLEKVPHTPFTGVGINFTWHVSPGDEPMESFTRRLFLPATAPFADEIVTDDARFGFYVSRDVPPGRLKLTVRPVRVTNNEKGTEEHFLEFAFNYHLDVADETLHEVISQHLSNWNDYEAMSVKLVALFVDN